MPDSLQPPDVDALRNLLRAVIDPENAVNIVDLGLVYEIRVEDPVVHVRMTLTSPGCPMGDMILEDVDSTLRKALPPGFTPEIEVVWEPPWSPELMSDKARANFGW